MQMDADRLTADLHLSLLSPNPISQPHASSVANISLHPPDPLWPFSSRSSRSSAPTFIFAPDPAVQSPNCSRHFLGICQPSLPKKTQASKAGRKVSDLPSPVSPLNPVLQSHLQPCSRLPVMTFLLSLPSQGTKQTLVEDPAFLSLGTPLGSLFVLFYSYSCLIRKPKNTLYTKPLFAQTDRKFRILYQEAHSNYNLLRIREGNRNQRIKYLCNKDKTIYQSTRRMKSSQIQRYRYQCENKINQSMDIKFSLYPSNSFQETCGCAIAEEKDKDFKIHL